MGNIYKVEAWEEYDLPGYYRKVGWTLNRMHMVNAIMKLSPSSVLDIGCLDGCYMEKLRELGYTGEYVGIDAVETHIEKAIARNPKEKFQVDDARKLSFSQNRFDLVLLSDVIQHLPEAESPLLEAFRVAKKYVLVSTYGSEKKTYTSHSERFMNTFYNRKDIVKYMPDNWKLVDFSKQPHPTTKGTKKSHKLFHFIFEKRGPDKFKFKFDKKFAGYMIKHVSQTQEEMYRYQLMCESEWDIIKKYIGHPEGILDLGCGLGRMSIYTNAMLKDDNAMYYLADSTGPIDRKIKAGWDPSSGFYTDLNLTAEFCDLNGLKNYEILDIQKGDLNRFCNIDFIMSFLSVGFHYPIENYFEELLEISRKGANMIFGVRRNRYLEHDFGQHFDACIRVPQDGRIDTKEELLILLGRK